jgi:O-antigen/teichoic acid export membrane protein
VILLATAGLDRSVLYRLSREPGEPGALVGGGYVAWMLRAVVAVGIVTAIGTALGARLLAPRSDLPDLARWFAMLCAAVPLAGAGQVLASWYQARGRLGPALLVPRLTEISRAVLLLLAWFLAPTPGAVALAVIASTAVPLLAWIALLPRGALGRPTRPPAGDTAYGLQLMLAALADRGVRRIDLLMIGFLSTGAATADYAVAAQLVNLTTLGNELLGPVFTPRMGRYFSEGRREEFAIEYEQNRLLTLALGLATAVLFVIAAPALLTLFGDYAGARPVLLALAAAFLIKIGFGATGRYLNMSGRAGWTLASTVALLVVMCGLNLLLIPRLGALGAALGTAIGFASINALHCVVIWRQDRFVAAGPGVLVLLAAAVGLLLAAAFDRLTPLAAGIGLAALWLLLGLRWWPIARRLLAARHYASR